jgi:hypothetical protein
VSAVPLYRPEVTMSASRSYPLRLEARLDEPLNPGLWLVKWLLAIPHYVVLCLLWIAFLVLTVIAFFAILFTGRYPRGVFDFNVGVLRWTWRVAYYSYGALGTDRYPPFTLGPAPDYPATLEVDYPERLSRGLVLVKWWLLALPHYLVVTLFTSGGILGPRDDLPGGGVVYTLDWGGLIGVLVLFAGVALLFTRRYPRGIFDFVLGMNRWVLRVAAYAALMTDAYPPFRLDAGPREPSVEPLVPEPPGGRESTGRVPDEVPHEVPDDGPHTVPDDVSHAVADAVGDAAAHAQVPPGPAPASGPAHAQIPPGPVSMSGPAHAQVSPGSSPISGPARAGRPGPGAGSIVAIVLGSLLAFAAVGGAGLGTALTVLDHGRGADGLVASSVDHVSTSGYALTVERIEVAGQGVRFLQEAVGRVRVRVDGGGKAVFVGIARQPDVARYLGGVAHDRIVRLNDRGEFRYERVDGGAPATPPVAETFWAAQASGPGEQTLTWHIRPGDWAVVLMNADGSASVAADVQVAGELPWLGGAAAWLFGTAAVLLLVGGALLVAGIRLLDRPAPPPAAPAAPVGGDPVRTGQG